MLARLLHLSGIDVTVFESDTSPDYRAQTGTIHLHSDTGLAAIREAGLLEEFEKYGRYDGQYMAIVDKTLHYYLIRRPDVVGVSMLECPEIDSARLREILINSLPRGMIRWGHHLEKVEDRALIFEEDIADGFDLIVGADGAWSKVRSAIDERLLPFYTGVAYYDLAIPDAEHRAPATYKLVNQGSTFAMSEGKRMSLQQLGDGRLYINASFVRKAANWMNQEKCGYDSTDLVHVKRALQKEYSDWSPELKAAINKAEGPFCARSLHILPIGTTWKHKTGLTLIGDAAHLMAPHAGEGVNQSLHDSVTLAQAIISSLQEGEDLDEEVKDFEVSMFARAKKTQQLSYRLMQDWMFTPGAPKSVMARAISRHANQKVPSMLQPLSTARIYSYFFFRSIFS